MLILRKYGTLTILLFSLLNLHGILNWVLKDLVKVLSNRIPKNEIIDHSFYILSLYSSCYANRGYLSFTLLASEAPWPFKRFTSGRTSGEQNFQKFKAQYCGGLTTLLRVVKRISGSTKKGWHQWRSISLCSYWWYGAWDLFWKTLWWPYWWSRIPKYAKSIQKHDSKGSTILIGWLYWPIMKRLEGHL